MNDKVNDGDVERDGNRKDRRVAGGMCESERRGKEMGRNKDKKGSEKKKGKEITAMREK